MPSPTPAGPPASLTNAPTQKVLLPTAPIFVPDKAELIKIDHLKGSFLLEGATNIGNNTAAFVNVVNTPALASLPNFNPKEGEGSSVHTIDLNRGDVKNFYLPEGMCATSVVATNEANILLVITNEGIFKLDATQKSGDAKLELWHKPKFTEGWPQGTRPNDCRVDPEGNLIMSWMGEGAHRDATDSRQAEVYLIRPDKSETLLAEGLYIPNGHVFIPKEDGTYRMLFNDTARSFKHPELPRAIDEYTYDPKAGTMTREGVFYQFPGSSTDMDFPDGMAISKDNKLLFVPMFFGGGVEVIDVHNATSLGRIKTPGANQTTSIAIMDNGCAVITTAAEFFTAEDHAKNPNAGSIFWVSLSSLKITEASPANTFKLN